MSKWISVNDRLPQGSRCWEQFLVVCKTKGGYDGGYETIEQAKFTPDMPPDKMYDADKPTTHYWTIIGEMNIPFDVTHWMPMPRLPKEK